MSAYPTEVVVTLYKDEEHGPRNCLCSVNETRDRVANVRVLIEGYGADEKPVPGWYGCEWRCPDGANLVLDEMRRQARMFGIPFRYDDKTEGIYMPGELDC